MIRGVVSVGGVRIHYRRLGQGPGMVLLHGYPQTGHMWRKVMPALAERFTVVAPDLRGYGDSDKPRGGYDKRTMAADIATLIRELGLAPVVLVGHDRGARVAHRFALDHPDLLRRLVLLDIAPTYDVFASTNQQSARRGWHWFFHQVPDLPEALTEGREEIYLRHFYRSGTWNPAAIEEEAIQEYVRCFRQPGAMRAGFEDYRAGATVDLEHDGADREKKIRAPTLVLWGGARRTPQAQDMVAIWKPRCEQVEGHAIPDSGHFIPEEQPQAVADAILKFVG
ncbi:MAG: alpha/beta hydrolase [Candidatus Rokubacteria bacterium]|nr:alpha/beta hydrolase [Candidatus Rokubacteria bacterium]MBI3826323.1 alpha/beta hydrolase [Candidatus Rokubacteria bacterium]